MTGGDRLSGDAGVAGPHTAHDGSVHLTSDGSISTVVIDRPSVHNAITDRMYGQLESVLDELASSDTAKVAVFTGAGSRAFSSGTDASYISTMDSAERGVAYERRIEGILGRLEQLEMPTVASIGGVCFGAGLLLAAACDVRIASKTALFGAPVARTMGNCLSAASMSLLKDRLGSSLVLDMIVRARSLSVGDLAASGFLGEVCDPDELTPTVSEVSGQLAGMAPLTIRASRELLRRLRVSSYVSDEDIVGSVYGSEDFRRGTRAFVAKDSPHWVGR